MARAKKKSKEYQRLSKHLTKLVSKANHRYDRMKKAGWNSPAIDTANKTGGRFKNSRSMSYREMQKEQKRVENFLNSKTSSKSGTRKSVNKLLKATGMDKKFKTGDVMKNKKTLDKYFQVYKKMREYDRVKGVGRTYQASMNAVTSVFESTGGKGSVDDILDKVISSLDIAKDDNWDKDETFNWIIG